MLRHIVLVKWNPETSHAQHQAMLDAIERLPSQVPEIIAASIGFDISRGPNNFDMAVVFDFENP